MTKVPAFHSTQEHKKPANTRVYHDKDTCTTGQEIRLSERSSGTGGYMHCRDCAKSN
jgi:hypothetical protein